MQHFDSFPVKFEISQFSCEICKLFTSNYFEAHLWMYTSKFYFKKEPTWCFPVNWELFKNTYFVKDLQTTGSEIPVRWSLYNKIASMMACISLTVVKRDFSTGISLWILWRFWENFVAEHLLATTSHMMLFFPLYRWVRFAA